MNSFWGDQTEALAETLALVQIGVHCSVLRLSPDISQAELLAAVEASCGDDSVDGVLVQLPLPEHLDEETVMESLDPRKDVDGFHPLNIGRMLARGIPPRFVPATPLGCMELLERCNVTIAVRFSECPSQ